MPNGRVPGYYRPDQAMANEMNERRHGRAQNGHSHTAARSGAPTATGSTTETKAGSPDHGRGSHHQTGAVVRRLKRAEGHLAAVRRMVEDGRDCPDILLQIAAVRAALDSTARVVLADHMESCLHDASLNGNANGAWDELRKALESFIR